MSRFIDTCRRCKYTRTTGLSQQQVTCTFKMFKKSSLHTDNDIKNRFINFPCFLFQSKRHSIEHPTTAPGIPSNSRYLQVWVTLSSQTRDGIQFWSKGKFIFYVIYLISCNKMRIPLTYTMIFQLNFNKFTCNQNI